jgi:hypothetical protein
MTLSKIELAVLLTLVLAVMFSGVSGVSDAHPAAECPPPPACECTKGAVDSARVKAALEAIEAAEKVAK